MNLDDRLRSAYRQQLEDAHQSFDTSGTSSFSPPARPLGVSVMAVAAAVVLLAIGIGIGSTWAVMRDSTDADVRLETISSVPVASQPDAGGSASTADDSLLDVDGEAELPVAAEATPTPTPTPNAPAAEGSDPEPEQPTAPDATPDAAAPLPDDASGDAEASQPAPDAAATDADPNESSGPATESDEPPAPPTEAADSAPTVTPEPASTAEPTVATSPTSEATGAADADPTATPIPPATPVPTAPAIPTEALTPTPTTRPQPTRVPTVTPVPTATPAPTATPTPTARPIPTSTPSPSYSVGVTNTVCPSGSRAALENASLRYLTETTGWDRLADLTNEQNGPYYFKAWEPGYPDLVTVEVALAEPVLATDIRVHQDPYNAVEGNIDFTTQYGAFSIGLSGTDGWRTHTFAEPLLLDRFTITRDQALENIMEVIVCVTT